MQNMLARLDSLADVGEGSRKVIWLERIAFVFLVLMVISAPHSIAATQIAWLTGMFVWLIRLFLKPRIKFRFGVLDAALWAFFAWSVLTSLTSYAPDISLNKLRGRRIVRLRKLSRRITKFVSICRICLRGWTVSLTSVKAAAK